MTQPDSSPFNRFCKTMQEFIKLILFAMLLLFIICKRDFIGTQLLYMISNINSLQVGNIQLTLNDETLGKFISGNWPAYLRVSNPKIKFIDGLFADKKYGVEFIDIQAKDDLNLNKGYIGDGNELMYLGNEKKELSLNPGDRLRIFTLKTNNENTNNILRKLTNEGKIKDIKNSVTALCITEKKEKITFEKDMDKIFVEKNKLYGLKKKKPHCAHKGKLPKKGLFKADEGEGDRIILIDRDNHILMDFDYFIIPKSVP
jgi:hypothetical protein